MKIAWWSSSLLQWHKEKEMHCTDNIHRHISILAFKQGIHACTRQNGETHFSSSTFVQHGIDTFAEVRRQGANPDYQIGKSLRRRIKRGHSFLSNSTKHNTEIFYPCSLCQDLLRNPQILCLKQCLYSRLTCTQSFNFALWSRASTTSLLLECQERNSYKAKKTKTEFLQFFLIG